MNIARVYAALSRRADHLGARIANNPDKDLSYDKAELAALCYVLAFHQFHAVAAAAPQPQSKESDAQSDRI